MRILHFIHSSIRLLEALLRVEQRCTIYRMNGHEVEFATLDSPESVTSWISRLRRLVWVRAGEFTATHAM